MLTARKSLFRLPTAEETYIAGITVIAIELRGTWLLWDRCTAASCTGSSGCRATRWWDPARFRFWPRKTLNVELNQLLAGVSILTAALLGQYFVPGYRGAYAFGRRRRNGKAATAQGIVGAGRTGAADAEYRARREADGVADVKLKRFESATCSVILPSVPGGRPVI